MQAKSSLSEEQRHTLESTYTFLKGAVVYLEAHKWACQERDEQQVQSLVDLGYLCQSKLLEQFPEILDFAVGLLPPLGGGEK